MAAGITGALVWWMDLPELLRALRKVLVLPVAAACLLNVLVMVAKGTRWYFIGTRSSVSLWQAVRLTILSFFVNSFIPARGGDVLRGLAAARENKSSRTTSIASVGLDKLLDMITVFALALAFPFLPQLPAWIKKGTLVSLALAFVLFALVLVVAVKYKRFEGGEKKSKILGALNKIASGFDSAIRPRILALALFLSLASYGLQIIMVYLCCLSTRIELTIPEAACALLVLNIAVSVPLTPLNVGTLHAAFVAVLLFLGFDKELSMTAAIVLHIGYVLPLFVLGPILGQKTLLMHVTGPVKDKFKVAG